MDNGSSSMVSSAKNKNVILIPDSDETSDSNNANNHNMINNNKKRPRHHADSCRDRDDVAFGCGHNNEDTNAASSLLHVDAKFKGVVPQQNGNWGAQIYANHQRVWLGTFKSARQAAMAYDSAAIKLRSGDLHRNFPWTALTLQEPQFQAHYTADAVLAMIKDGSYQSKFEHFIRVRSMASWSKQVVAVDDQISPSTRGGPSALDFGKIRVWAADSSQLATTRKLLFQKELTPSDVGKLNRLVIPKKYAVKYFPFISEENVDDSDDVELVFYDKQLTPWRFRYCYWKSSQSYVFTRGWNRFVKENNLKANDVVTFYSCDCGDVSEGGNISQSFCLIDATANHNHNNNNHKNHNGTIESKASLNNEEGKGFRLFGVDIK